MHKLLTDLLGSFQCFAMLHREQYPYELDTEPLSYPVSGDLCDQFTQDLFTHFPSIPVTQ